VRRPRAGGRCAGRRGRPRHRRRAPRRRHAGASPTRGDWLAIAIVERALAHAGLDGFTVGGVPARTLSAPAIDNRSLLVDPQRHSFATRDTDRFPPLVRS
jgi:hypothetical protein